MALRGSNPRAGGVEAALRADASARLSAGAALVLVPSFLYMMVLLQAATVTVSVAQVESVRRQLELLTDEVERLIPAAD